MKPSQAFPAYPVVWETVGHIPKGKVATYGEIAHLCGLIHRARFIGQALRNLPPNSNIPWHRVINSQGKISFPKHHTSYQRQKKRLMKEGVVFVRERIDLEKYGWLHWTSAKMG